MRTPLLLLFPLLLSPACRDTGVRPEDGLDDALTASLVADPVSVIVGAPVRLDGGTSTDAAGVEGRFSDCAIGQYAFDFGDGATVTSEAFFVDHVYAAAGTFTVTLTVQQGDDEDSATALVEVRYPPPTLLGLDVSQDDKAVIGEWVSLQGRGFREGNVPSVWFADVEAAQVAFWSEFEIGVQVPPRAPSGLQDVVIDFPAEDDADTVFEAWVARYALATDAFRGRVSVVEFGGADSAELRSQSLELDGAAVVKISADGAIALLGDARYAATLAPTVVVVDLTADFQPVVIAELPDVGDGPLHAIAVARAAPVAVVVDLSGFTVLDLTDPANPQVVGTRTAFSFGELGPTAAELSPDGRRLALLSTFNDRVRFYDLTPQGPVYSQDWVAVGAGAQDMVVHPETGLLYVLGGGGEGALPPDFNLTNSTLTIVDFAGFEPENVHGAGVYLPTSAAPLPIDLAVGASGTAYVTTFDQNFSDLVGAFSTIAGNPGSLSGWVDLIEGLTSLSVGAVQPLEGPLTGTMTDGAPIFAPFGFPTGLDVRFDERLAVATVIGLGTTLEFFNGDNILDLSLDIDYSVAVFDLVSGSALIFPVYTAPVVSYVDFVLNYDLTPVVELLLPPWALGDVAIQP